MAVVKFQTFAERNAKLAKITGIATQMKALSGRALGYHDYLRSLGLLTGPDFDVAYEEVSRILSDGPYMEERLAAVDAGVLIGMLTEIDWYSFYPSPIKCGLSPAGGSAVFDNEWTGGETSYQGGTHFPAAWNLSTLTLHVAEQWSFIVFRKTPIGTDYNRNHQVSPLSMLRVGDTFDITGATSPELIGEVTGDGAYTVEEILAQTDAADPNNLGADEKIYVCGLRFSPDIPALDYVFEDTGLQLSVRTGEMPRPAVVWSTVGNKTGYIAGAV